MARTIRVGDFSTCLHFVVKFCMKVQLFEVRFLHDVVVLSSASIYVGVFAANSSDWCRYCASWDPIQWQCSRFLFVGTVASPRCSIPWWCSSQIVRQHVGLL